MDDRMLKDLSVIPETIVQPLLNASKESTLEIALERLTEMAKKADGRAELASKNIVTLGLQLCQILGRDASFCQILLSALKLVRNLCVEEARNENLFLEQGGVGIVSTIISSVELGSDFDYEIIRMGLQLLGNVVLAGGEHQRAVWFEFFPLKFLKIAGVRRREICDPLCMVLCICSCSTDGLIEELCTEQGLPIIVEIIRTVSKVGFKEHWIKLLLSRACLEGLCFPSIFSELYPVTAAGNSGNVQSNVDYFATEQAFLLSFLSEILNEQINDIVVSNEFALHVLKILRDTVEVVDVVHRGKSGLPTGYAAIDVLGYSLTILRDVCACGGLTGLKEEGSVDVVDMLLSSGLIELLINLLNNLEPPSIVKKAVKQGEAGNWTSSKSFKQCPYKGFRRDILAIVGNCAYRRRRAQDEIREKNGILLILQQCVTDEDNPYLREWGIWSVRNLMEGNTENQRVVTDLENQGTVDVPEITGLGLRVEMDPKTRRAKLVNA